MGRKGQRLFKRIAILTLAIMIIGIVIAIAMPPTGDEGAYDEPIGI